LRTTSRGLAAVGDLVSQMYRFKTELPSTKPTLKFASNPNCAKPLLTAVFYFTILIGFYFSTEISEKYI
jgi:hypothetical protein